MWKEVESAGQEAERMKTRRKRNEGEKKNMRRRRILNEEGSRRR